MERRKSHSWGFAVFVLKSTYIPVNLMSTKSLSYREAYRQWGFMAADIDPFSRYVPYIHRQIAEIPEAEREPWHSAYCGPVGLEFSHIPYQDRYDWLAERMENRNLEVDESYVFNRLLAAETFERFIHTKYVGTKRFSIEGIASLIPLLDSILDRAATVGFENVIIGMSHRGRLTAMHLITCLEAHKIFAAFEDVDPRKSLGGGDVKYHRGATGVYQTRSGRRIGVRMASNPSHLEAINPVILGRVRGEQERIGDAKEHGKVLAIVVHGDAAFAGQGIAAETLNFMDLHGFSVGGTINIIANNFVGFTAVPSALHSSDFATSVARRLPVPIFHVNAERPSEVYRVGQMAMDYRKEFSSDVVIDLIGYRRYGHNEADDPSVTQPLLYKKIKDHPVSYEAYAKRIGITEEDIKQRQAPVIDHLDQELTLARSIVEQPAYFTHADYWKPFVGGYYKPEYEVETAISPERFQDVADALVKFPGDFNLHPKLKKLIELRTQMGNGGKPIDWGMAEALAFGSLLWQGTSVRIVGQDSCRGTFNQRHAVFYDYENETRHAPLAHLHDNQARFDVYDSMLSEAAAVGFEYGFSRQYPESLVCWEAQFGDFANGAQIIIDQFLSAGEDKWGLLSGLVMLLPHGYEGMGPEHSSARIERFLHLSAEDSMQVCQLSTSAQFFHLLRRQVLRKWRKPLIVFTPKSMLRLSQASSNISSFTSGKFETVLDDEPGYQDAQRLLVCSGKIAHELRKERKAQNDTRVAIITVEQFSPFPEQDFLEVAGRYTNVRSVSWVQEEPANMGALFYMKPLLQRIFGHKAVSSIKRSASASPATGSHKAHELEQNAIMKMAFAK